jgi:SAM-dependent methyltransferase
MSSSGDKTIRRYQGEQGHRYHAAKRSIPEQALPWVARLRASKLAPHIKAGDVVLEYGAGLGWNLAELACARRLGFDVADFLDPSVRQGGVEFVPDAAALPGEFIDVIICHHTLEHILRPAETLECIRRLLNPGGTLLLFVPYEKERRYRRFDPSEPNGHLYSWNVQTLGRLVEESGFKVSDARLGRFGQERFAAKLASRLGLGERGFRLLRAMANLIKHEFEVRLRAVKA